MEFGDGTALTALTLLVSGTGDQTFTHTGGRFIAAIDINKTSGSFILGSDFPFSGDFTYTAGTVNQVGFAVNFGGWEDATITTNGLTFVDLGFLKTAGSTGTVTLADDFTVSGNLTVDKTDASTFSILPSGVRTITLQGNFSLAKTGGGTDLRFGTNSLTVLVSGTGDQTFTHTDGFFRAAININKTSGSFILASDFEFHGDFTYTAGTVNQAGFTITLGLEFSVTITTNGLTFVELAFKKVAGGTTTVTLVDDFTVSGNLTVDNTDSSNFTISPSGVRTITLQANFSLANTSALGSLTFGSINQTLLLSGTAAQTLTQTGGNFDAHLTVNKASGTASLASDFTLNATGANLTITSGTLDQGATFNLTSGEITIGAAGTLLNLGTGDLTLSGNVSNSGTIDLNSNGAACGDSDSILIRSSVAATQRLWSGTGSFTLVDVDVQDQAGTASITVESGTNTGNNGANWTFAACPQIVWDGGGATNNWSEAANWVDDVKPGAGDDVLFDATSVKYAIIDEAVAVASLTVTAAYTGAGVNDGHLDGLGSTLGITVTGDVVLDNKHVTFGGRVWTISGNFDYRDVTTRSFGSSTIVMNGTAKTITGTTAGGGDINNLTIDGTISVAAAGRVAGVLTVKAGKTFTTNLTWRTLTTSDVRVEAGATIDGTGELRVQGDISQMDGTISVSTLTILINATGTTFLPATYDSPSVNIEASLDRTWTPSAGTYTFTGNLVLSAPSTGNPTLDASVNNPNFVLHGNVSVSEPSTGVFNWNKGTGTITLSGAGAGTQTIDFSGKSVEQIIVNDAGATKQLAGNVTTNGLTVTAGTFDQGASFNLTSGAITVGAAGTLQNLGTGDLTLSDDVSNSGAINLNGGGAACGDADSILIRSSVAATQRLWSGAGAFTLVDVDVQDQAGSASVAVQSGTNTGNNGANWSFGACWYDPNWGFRMKITVDNAKVSGSTDLSYFPVLINTTDLDWRDIINLGNVAQADGGDILFTSSDGTTKLDHEIESYDNTSGALVAWVEVPILGATADTVLYIYYGNGAGALAEWNINGTWDEGGSNNFRGVWHLDEELAGTGTADVYQDSTSNNNHCDDNVSATGQTGQVDGGQQFNDSADHINNCGDPNVGNAITVEAWINLTNVNAERDRFLSVLPEIAVLRHDGVSSVGQLHFFIKTGGTLRHIRVNGSLTAGSWYYVVGTWDGTTQRLYKNGTEVASATPGGTLDGETDIDISSLAEAMDGYLDEVQISNVARSADWIATEYNNQKTLSSFYIVDLEETVP